MDNIVKEPVNKPETGSVSQPDTHTHTHTHRRRPPPMTAGYGTVQSMLLP